MESLIINKRHELPFGKRIIWDIVTVMLWGGFIYLWKPLFRVLYNIITLDAPADELADWIYGEIHSVTFEHAIVMLIATPIILFLLSRLNRHKASSEHLIFHFDDYANHFNVEKEALMRSTKSQLVTVYFNDQGQIIKLDDQIIESK